MSSTILPGGPFYYHFEGKRDRPIIEFDQYGYFYNTSWSWQERENRQRVGPKDDVPIVCDFDDTTIAIGQPDRVNEVWIYEYTKTSNTWSSPTVLSNPGTTSSDFGSALSMNWDGNRLVVGSPGDNKFYVYDKDATTGSWSYYSNVILGTTTTGVEFGSSVSIAQESSDTICVGAPGSATGGTSVFVYEYDSINSTWSQTFSNNSTDVDVLVPYDATQNITLNNNLSRYGHSVSMSLNGEHFAVGAPGSQEITQIDQTNSNVSVTTTTTTTTIPAHWDLDTYSTYNSSDTPRVWMGYSMSMSGDGKRAIITSPYTTQWNTGGGQNGRAEIVKWSDSAQLWYRIGYISGIAAGAQLGVSAAISRNGLKMIVGGRNESDAQGNTYRGSAVIYNLDATTAATTGSPSYVYGEASGDGFGDTVAIDADGSRIAVAAPFHDTGGTNSGRVRIYEWNGSSYVTMGSPIDGGMAGNTGDNWGSRHGRGVAMSDDGSRVVIGSPVHAGARVYQWSGSQWQQMGQHLNSPQPNCMFGNNVSMNAAGTRVAIGAPNYDNISVGSYDGGAIFVYDWNGSSWTQLGQMLHSSTVGNHNMGASALSSDGSRIVCGHNPQNPAGYGQTVRVFDYNTSTSTWDQVTTSTGPWGNNWGMDVAISSDGSRFAVSGNRQGYSNQGKMYTYTFKAAQTYTNTTTSGVYVGTNVNYTSTWQNTLGSGGMYFYRHYNYLPSGGNYAGSMTNNTTYDPNGLPGFTRVFTRGTNSTWQGYGTQLGQVIHGNNVWTLSEQNATTLNQSWGWSRCGWKVALCKSDVTTSYTDSLRLVVSSPGQPGINKALSYSAQSGAVDTYRYDSVSGTWVHESTLYGDQQRDEYGHSISLDYTGNRLAISTKGQRESVHYLTPGYRLETSKVSVLEWNSDKWWEATPTIYLNGSTFPNSGESLSRTAYDSINVALTNGKHVFVTSPLYGNVFTQHVTLTQNFIGNSLFEGYVAANKYYVGANEAAGNSTNTKGNKIIEFGGFYGDAVYELTSIENRVYDSYETNESPAYLGRTEMLLSKLSQQRGIDAIRSVTQEYLVGTAPTTIGGSVIRRKALGTSGITNSQTASVHVSPTTTWSGLSDWYENFEFDKYDRDTSSFGVDSRGNVVINPDYRRPSLVWRGVYEYYPGYSWPYLNSYPDATAVDITQGQDGPDDDVDPGTFYGNAKLDVRGDALIRDRLILGNDLSNMTNGWGREPAGLFINTTNSDNFDFTQQPWKIYLEDFYTSRDDSQTKLRTDYATMHGTMFQNSSGYVDAYDNYYGTSNGHLPDHRAAFIDAILAQGSNNPGQKTGIAFWIKIRRTARDGSSSSNRHGIYRINGTAQNGQWITGTAGIVWATERVLCTWGETTWGATEYGGTASNYPGFWIWINWRDYLYSVTNTAPYGFAFKPYDHTGTYLSHTDWEMDDNWHHVVFELPGGNNVGDAVTPGASNSAMYYDGTGPHPVGTYINISQPDPNNSKIYWGHGTRVRLGAEHYVLSSMQLAQFRIYISWGVATQAPNARELYKEGAPINRIICKGFGKFTQGVFTGRGILTRSGALDPVTGVKQWQYILYRNDNNDTVLFGGAGSELILTNYNGTITMDVSGRVGIGFSAMGNTTHKLLIDGSGGATGGFHTASDDRIKYNETDIIDPLALINQLKPQKYEKITKISEKIGTWIPTDEEWENEKDNYTHSLEFGFVAQDVRKIPELAFLVSGEETRITETEISSEEYEQLDLTDQEKCVPFYVRYEPNNEEQKETKIKHEVYVTLNDESRAKYTLKYTLPVDTQTPLTLDYTGLFVLTTAGLQKVDAQLQTTKTELQNTKEDVRIAKDELQTKANDAEFKLEKDKIAALETDLEREKLKTTNLQERILVMEHAYHALLERVSDLENQT